VETQITPQEEVSQPDSQPVIFPWLTLEWLLYALIFAVALALRWWNLSHYPLSDVEAQQSLLALALYHGNLPAAGYYSPLLVTLNWLTFMLFGSSDASVRLASVLPGMLLVIAPVTLRRQLGARVCLIAATLLATSPAAIFLSRTLNSEVGVAAGALLVLSGFFNWITDHRQGWLFLLAAGLALMLAAGTMAVSLLIVFALVIAIQYPTFKSLWADETVSDRAGWQRAAMFFVGALIILSTAALFNLFGISMLTGALSDWLNRFTFTPRADGGFNAVFLLTIYESLIVFAGLAGLAMTFIRRSFMSVTFSIWFVTLLLLDLLMFGRPVSNVILPVVPLAFLGASAIGELWDGLAKDGKWQNEGLILASGLIIAGVNYVGLTGWTISECILPTPWLCQNASWLQSVVLTTPLLLFLIIVIAFWFLNGAGTAIRGAALTGVVVGLLLTLNIGWRLNYGPLMDLAYQPLAGTPPSTELVMLTNILATQSAERVGDETLLDVTIAGIDSPALRWQLRNYRHLEQGVDISAPTSAIITPTSSELGLDQPYLGQDFALNATWSPVGLPLKDLIKWLIYRQGNARTEGEEVILWLNAAPEQ